jgi:hypothetical protein
MGKDGPLKRRRIFTSSARASTFVGLDMQDGGRRNSCPRLGL